VTVDTEQDLAQLVPARSLVRRELRGECDVRQRDMPRVGAGPMRWARAIAEAVFSPGDGPLDPERATWLQNDLDDFLAHAGTGARRIFRLCAFAITFVGPLFAGKFTPLYSLPVPERLRVLERVEKSVMAPALLAIKAMLCIVYFEHPDAVRDIGGPFGCKHEAP